MPNLAKVRVLFVCLGNSCRSPMAEAISRREAADIIEPSSAGIYPLGFVEELTVDTLRHNHYSAHGLTSKRLQPQALAAADLIINMTGEVLDPAFASPDKVEIWNIADPYGKDAVFYQGVLEELVARIERLAKWLRAEHQKNPKS